MRLLQWTLYVAIIKAGGIVFGEQRLVMNGKRVTYGKLTGTINASATVRDFISKKDRHVRVDTNKNGTWLSTEQLSSFSISDHTGKHFRPERNELYVTDSVQKGFKNATVYFVLLAQSGKIWEKTRIQCKRYIP